MSKTLIVTRHASIVAWLSARGITGEVRASLEESGLAGLAAGDRVIGPLQFRLAEELVDRGVIYQAIDLDLHSADRGRELSVAEMDAAGAELVRYVVRRADPPELVAAQRAKPRAAGERVRLRFGHRSRSVLRGIIAVLLLTTGVVSQNWLFQTLWDTFQPAIQAAEPANIWRRMLDAAGSGKGGILLLQSGAAFLLFALASMIAYRWGGRILHATFAIQGVEPRCVLITGLSRPPADRALLDAVARLPLEILGASVAEIENLQQQIDREIASHGENEQRLKLRDAVKLVKTLKGGFSWQQPLRTIRGHLPALRHVLVIVSEQTADHFAPFEAFLRGRLDAAGYGHVSIRRMRHEINMEHHDQILAAFKSAIAFARSHCGVQEKDIAIDCTPGSKIFSIAAAIATINRDVTVSYVNNDGRLSAYDGSISLLDNKS
jgi:putative CRISPR-associated protein (TIGR02620 family)